MAIKVTFDQPEYISAGTERDILKIIIREPDWFKSQVNSLTIKQDSESEVKIPKIMPDNDLTRAVLEVSENLKDVSNTISVSSAAINLFTQGPITFIWGLINCIQVLSYFPLINVAMPANMHFVFMIMAKMASFEIVDKITDVVDHIEDEAELRDD